MLEAGRVYAAQPPLFTAKVGDKCTARSATRIATPSPTSSRKGNRQVENIRWQRFKGLGEMNVEELAECALDPHSRILRRITMARRRSRHQGGARCSRCSWATTSPARRDFLVENSTLLDHDALDI